jgi:hypothetical protein
MSKFILLCSCTNCKAQVTTQSLSQHITKCTSAPKHICITCGVQTSNEKYCSRTCAAKQQGGKRGPYKNRKVVQPKVTTMDKVMSGKCSTRETIRKYIAKARGYKCEHCGVSEWNNKPITLIVDHIDGNAGNNDPTNIQLLCPNCNSQTSTFGGRNKGNGRRSRGLPLH